MHYEKIFKTTLLVGMLALGANVRATTNANPQEIFNDYCFSCHGTGWEDAPVVGDGYAWEERTKQGIDVLLKHTVEGYNSMPPKGGCASCTSEELKTLIQWMIE